MERRRVAEVHVEEDGGYGSGYLITDRLVLTARHVAEPVDAVCQVTLLGPADPRGAATMGSPRAARTVWVSSSHDVALVALDRPAEGYPRRPVRFGFVDPDGLADECCGIGFPDAQRREGGNADRVVKADLSWVSRDGRFNADIANTAPDREKGWKGLSGMALFAKDSLVAVIEAVPPNFAGGVLTAIGVASFCDDSGFLDCLRRHDANGAIPDRDDGSQPVGFRDAIVGNLFFIDRIPQVSRIIDGVTNRSAPRGRPLLDLIPGEPDDVHHLVVQRLAAEEEMRRFLGRDTDAIDTIIEIPWPQSTVIDAPGAFRKELWSTLTNALCCQEAADVASVRRALDRPDAPRAFWTQINVGRSGPGHGELFRLWLDLWNGLARFRDSQTGTRRPAVSDLGLNALGQAILVSAEPDRALERLDAGPAADGIARHGDLHPVDYPDRRRRVVLIDELDKAPRDTPNDLLLEIDAMRFDIPELRVRVEGDPANRPIVVITSNSEKSLPEPFLRRCVYHHIPAPGPKRRREIVERRRAPFAQRGALFDEAMTLFGRVRDRLGRPPGTTELLAWLDVLETLVRRAEVAGRTVAALEAEPAILHASLRALAKTQEDPERAEVELGIAGQD